MSARVLKQEPLNILLVEDNADHAELVRQSLRELSIANRVFHVADGEAALDYLLQRGSFADRRLSPQPQLILLDLRLPKVDGLEVLGRIKGSAELRQIPVVVLTTSDADSDLRRAYDLHANSYLVKPVGFLQFNDLMHEIGTYWLGWNRTADSVLLGASPP